MTLGPLGRQIEAKLTAALSPQKLEVLDDSHKHAGHAGSRPGGETHFTVKVVSRAFAGKPALERHRMVHAILAGELASGVHALSISARTPP